MHTSPDVRARHSAHVSFERLHALPCGCVVALYRTLPWDVEVVALEARGPHCVHRQHALGEFVGVRDGSDWLSR